MSEQTSSTTYSVRQRPRHCCQWFAVCATLIVAGVYFPSVIVAQESPTTDPPSSSTPTESPASPAISPPKPETDTGPKFFFSRVKLDAEVVSDRVNILATVQVEIRGEGWHRIPLRFSQAHVWEYEYEGPGEEMPDVTTRSVDEGMYWMLKGVGKHVLKFSMWVPFKHSLSGTQFQLSLPSLPTLFAAEVTLKTSNPNSVMRTNKTVSLSPDVVRTAKSTEFKMSVDGPRLDISWHNPVTSAATVSQVGTRLQVKPTGEKVMLFVQQSIDSYEQSSQELLVRLPTDFELSSVKGEQYRSHELVPDREGWVRIHLNNTQSKRFELNWILSRPLSKMQDQFVIDGFEVEGAVREEGVIRIDEFEGFRVQPLTELSTDVHRTSVSEVRAFGVGTPLTAFAYFKQPYALQLEVAPLEPFYVVKPYYQLVVRDNELVLHLNNLVSFNRGSITQLELDWPGFSAEGWEFVEVESDQTETGKVVEGVDDDAVVTLQWPKPQQNQFPLSCTFRRDLEMSPSQPESTVLLPITFPIPRSSRTEPPLLEIRSLDHLSVILEGDQNPGVVNLALDKAQSQKLQTDYAIQTQPVEDVSQRVRLVESPYKILANITSQQRSVHTESVVEIKEIASGELTIQQTVSFDVAYGRLQLLEINLPEVLVDLFPDELVTESVEIKLGDTLLNETYASGRLRTALPEPLKGKFELTFDYRFQVDMEGGEKEVELPLMTVVDYPFELVRCMVSPVETVQVRTDPAWTAIRNSLWVSAAQETPITEVPLVLDYLLADSSQQYVIERAWYRTRFLQDGSTDTWAEFRLNSPPSRLLFSVPSEANVNEYQFMLDGEPLTKTKSSINGEERQITLTIPETVDETPILSMRYRQSNSPGFGLSQQIQVTFPEFPKSVWIDETIWEVKLPVGNHLFTYPALDPQFEWTRGVIFWERKPTNSYLNERVSFETGPVPVEFQFENEEFYAFRGFGPIKHVEFRSMNQSLILLMGAGLTLLLGFMFWTFPYTRNVFSLLVLSFLFSAASLWYLEPLQLLLQPAVLGLVLALTVTLIDSATRRRQRSQTQVDRTVLHPNEEPSHAVTQMYVPASQGSSSHGSSKLSNR